jgi:hypothetical protein
LALLSVKDEDELLSYIEKFKQSNLKYTIFREPDIGNQITSVAVEPCEKAAKLCSNLKLMLKDLKEECYA